MKALTILLLIIPFVCYSQQPDQNVKTSPALKISLFTGFEKQGYQETASNGYAALLIMEKYGSSINYGANFQLSNRILKNFEFDYGLGFSITNHNFNYSLPTSSLSDYLGFANEKNHGYYLSGPISIYYHKKQSKNFFFSPGIIIKPQILLFKQSKITPYNYVYDFLSYPGSEFITFVPKYTVDLSVGYKISDQYNILTGFYIENNSKYYEEIKSEMFFREFSFGFKLAVSLTDL
jgi:hypothetical protein